MSDNRPSLLEQIVNRNVEEAQEALGLIRGGSTGAVIQCNGSESVEVE
jgi:hypothetical protein